MHAEDLVNMAFWKHPPGYEYTAQKLTRSVAGRRKWLTLLRSWLLPLVLTVLMFSLFIYVGRHSDSGLLQWFTGSPTAIVIAFFIFLLFSRRIWLNMPILAPGYELGARVVVYVSIFVITGSIIAAVFMQSAIRGAWSSFVGSKYETQNAQTSTTITPAQDGKWKVATSLYGKFTVNGEVKYLFREPNEKSEGGVLPMIKEPTVVITKTYLSITKSLKGVTVVEFVAPCASDKGSGEWVCGKEHTGLWVMRVKSKGATQTTKIGGTFELHFTSREIASGKMRVTEGGQAREDVLVLRHSSD
jgi:hypothetical protein